MMFTITTLAGILVGSELPPTAPAIRLEEGRVAEKGGRKPKDLAPGESTTVVYPLMGGEPLTCVVARAAAESTPEDAPNAPETKPAAVAPTRVRFRGRRAAGSTS